MFAEFEQKVHDSYDKGEDTTADALNELYYDFKLFGESDIPPE